MIKSAESKYVRISEFKVRRIANELRGKGVLEAEASLTVMPNKGALALKKAIHSARTNYLQANSNVDEANLLITKILVNKGPMFKRYQPIARGRANRILKRTCHIYVEVSANEGVK